MTTERGRRRLVRRAAARLVARLAARFGFGAAPPSPTPEAGFDAQYERAEASAARHWRWEYRRCGKRRCHCAHDRGHGPYKYTKVRRGGTPVSVYVGK